MNNNNSVVSQHHPSVDDRQAAERKLCRFFMSFGINAMVERERLIDPFIMRAIQFWRAHGSLDLASLALDEAEIDLRAWFAGIFDQDGEDADRSMMTGRAAFLMCGGPKHFLDLFLLPVDALPSGFIDMMRHHAPVAVPPSDLGEMHHQPYEAWSLRHVLAKAGPFERSMMHTLGHLFKRDGRGLSFIGRNTGSTS